MKPEYRTSWRCPEEADARILGGPNIVKPLQRCAPRVYMGQAAWDRLRKRTYFLADYKCQICGKDCSTPGTLDAHELYTVNYMDGTAVFAQVFALDKQCVDSETEVLTADGWKKIPNVTTNDLVACWSRDKKIIFAHPTDTVVSYQKEAIRICGTQGEELFFSPKHRLPLLVSSHRTTSGNIVDMLAENYKPSYYYDWILGGYTDGDESLTAEERVFIAIEADGCLSWDKENPGPRSKLNGKRERGYNSRYGSEDYRFTYTIGLKKQRKIDRLKKLLPESGLKYKIVGYDKRGHIHVNVWSNKELKHFRHCFDIQMGHRKAKEFIEELLFWDGHRETQNWYTTKPEEVDFVQAAAAQCNIRTYVTKRTEPHKKKSYKVSFCPKYNRKSSKLLSPEKISWGKNMYCLSVPTSYFIARRNGFVFVTGNCHSFYHSGRLLTLHKQGSPLYSAKHVLNVLEHGFKLIHDWNVAHPDKPKLKAYGSILDGLKQEDLREPLAELIKKYDMEFWEEDPKRLAKWKDWKLVYGRQIIRTPYASPKEWEEAMAEASKTDSERQPNPFSGGVFDEINDLLKEEK